MDLESLQCFVTVCEEKKLSEAAEKLFISKQALSATIRKLEEEVKADLFVRSRSGMELTEEGKILYARAARMLELWEGTKHEIKEVSGGKEGRLFVGFSMMSMAYWNRELEADFIQENPLIDLCIENDISAHLREKLKRRELDVMITATKTHEPENYTRILLREFDTYLIIHEQDPLASLDRIEPSDLQGRRLCFSSGNEWYMQAMRQYFKNNEMDVECIMLPGKSYIVDIFKAAAQNAIFVTSGIIRLFFGDMKGFALRKLETENAETLPKYGVYAMTLREREREGKILRFVDFLRYRLP